MLKKVDDIILQFDNSGAVTFGHFDYAQLVKKGIVSQTYHSRAYKFATVRNPFTRSISLYHHSQKMRKLSADVSFIEFLRILVTIGAPEIGLFHVNGFSQCRPQTDWLLRGGEFIADDIWRFEQLDEMSEAISQRFGIAPLTQHENKGAGYAPFGDYFAEGVAVDRVRVLYESDFDAFGYSRDPTNARRIV
jgi:hypothetical protein